MERRGSSSSSSRVRITSIRVSFWFLFVRERGEEMDDGERFVIDGWVLFDDVHVTQVKRRGTASFCGTFSFFLVSREIETRRIGNTKAFRAAAVKTNTKPTTIQRYNDFILDQNDTFPRGRDCLFQLCGKRCISLHGGSLRIGLDGESIVHYRSNRHD